MNYLCIGIDAANESTYKKIRGGNWKRLIDNLIFAGYLMKKRGGEFALSFVVQYGNYKEIPEFINLAKKVGANIIYLKALGRANHSWSDSEWFMNNVLDFRHPEFENCLRILDSVEDTSQTLIIENHAKLIAYNQKNGKDC